MRSALALSALLLLLPPPPSLCQSDAQDDKMASDPKDPDDKNANAAGQSDPASVPAGGQLDPASDPAAGQPDPASDPAGGQPDPAPDTMTGQPDPASHPAAGQPDPASDPAAGQPDPASDPAAGQPDPASDPAAGQPDPASDPAAGQPDPASDPAAGQPDPASDPAAGQPDPASNPAAGQLDPASDPAAKQLDPAAGQSDSISDPTAGQLDPASDPAAGQPDPASDPVSDPAGQPDPASDPAGQPDPASNPTARQPDPASDPAAGQPDPTSDPAVVQPDPASDPVVQPDPASDPAGQPDPASVPAGGRLDPASHPSSDPASDPAWVPPDPASDPVAGQPDPASDPVAGQPDPASDPAAGQPDPASSPTPGQPDAAPVPVHTVGTPSPGKQGLAPEHTTVSSGSGPNVTGNQNSDNQGNLSVTPTTKGGGPVTPATADIVGTTNSATLRMPAGGSLKPPENSSKEQQGLPPQGAPTMLSPALGTVATPPVEGPTGVSSKPASTDLQDSTTTSSTWTLGNKRITCEPPERLTEKLLVLNLTRASLCAGSPPDDKLVTILCRSAKATYDLAQDHCHVLLAPISESRAVAVKEITIQTNLLPKDVFELLKDKWDDLQEVGVSDMQLGDQGPPEEAEDRFSMPLIITIVCMASFLLLVAALYGCCHQRLSQRKDQQRLTEELQTVENGYHDNPTLEVMETSSEMQEKKVVSLNGELGDSWIVPLDNLTKDDLDEEEDTHL